MHLCLFYSRSQTTVLMSQAFFTLEKQYTRWSISGLPKIGYCPLGSQLHRLASGVTGKRILGQAMDQVNTLFNIFILRSLFLPLPKEEPLALVVWAHCLPGSVYIDNQRLEFYYSMFGALTAVSECVRVRAEASVCVYTRCLVLCVILIRRGGAWSGDVSGSTPKSCVGS